MEWVVLCPHPGSARRFFQPLSGLLASPSFTALFRAAATPDRSLQGLPLVASCGPLSRPRCSLAVIHRRAMTRRPRPFTCSFPDVHTPKSAVASFPCRLWVPFSRAEARFPVALGRDRRNHHVPPASPTSEPSSRFESVRAVPSCPGAAAVALLTSRPSRVLPTNLGACDPPDLEGRTPFIAVGTSPSARTRGSEDSSPQSRVWISSSTEVNASTHSAASDSLRSRAAPPLGDVSFSLDL